MKCLSTLTQQDARTLIKAAAAIAMRCLPGDKPSKDNVALAVDNDEDKWISSDRVSDAIHDAYEYCGINPNSLGPIIGKAFYRYVANEVRCCLYSIGDTNCLDMQDADPILLRPNDLKGGRGIYQELKDEMLATNAAYRQWKDELSTINDHIT